MDHTEERYDPDGDVSRFLDSPDHDSSLLLSPLPIMSQEAEEPTLSPLPLSSESEEVNEPMMSTWPQIFRHELQQFPQEPYHQGQSLLPQVGVLQQAQLISPQEVVHQVPEILPQETHQRNPGFDGISSVPAVDHMKNQVMIDPLNIKGIILLAMEGIPLEGSSSSNPRNDSIYEPIFHHYLPGHGDCSDCVPLRIVSHTSPIRNLFFSIHGGTATFNHAVFDIEYFGRDGSSTTDRLYVDLSMRSHNWVKSFILGFTNLLQTDRSGTVHDSVSCSYNTLCADMNSTTMDEISSMDMGTWYQELPDLEVGGDSSHPEEETFGNTDPSFDSPTEMPPFTLFGKIISPPMPEPGFDSTKGAIGNPNGTATIIPEVQQPVPTEPAPDASHRSSGPSQLALQRRRTRQMGLPELAAYLHLPIEVAAKRLKMCSTALKKVCRKNGIYKWPSRQISALNRRIERLDKELVARAHMLTGLFALKEQMDKVQAQKISIYKKMFQNWKEFCAKKANNSNDSDDYSSDGDGNGSNGNENGNDNMEEA